MSGLTDAEREELLQLKSTSLPVIQESIRNSGDNASLLRYTNWLLNNVLFPLNFFDIDPSFKDGNDELTGILKEVHYTYFKQDKKIGPIDLVLFMCGFEPVAVRPGQYEQMEYGTPISPMLEKTTDVHKKNFIPLQKKGREFLDKLLSFGPFNKHLDTINKNIIPSNQPHRVVMLTFTGITSNENFIHIIEQLFITPDERKNPKFERKNNSLYMSELKTKRLMKLFGLPADEINDIWSRLTPPSSSRRPSKRTRSASPSPSRMHSDRPRSATPSSSPSSSRRPSKRPPSASPSSSRRQSKRTYTGRGGRRTSRRKQTKSRNPRKRKSIIQRRRKSVKHSKS
jgi:hypothetical protein